MVVGTRSWVTAVRARDGVAEGGEDVSEAEFDEQATAIAEQVRGAEFDERVAAACRGSGNPAALAWLAEGLALGPGTDVVDLGAGLGGPAAWLGRRFGCAVLAAEPAGGAVRSARDLFGLTCVRSSADASPFRGGAFDVGLLLGVVSVVDDPLRTLAEARRVARRLGVLEYCAAGADTVHAGGSRFPGVDVLGDLLDAAGWMVDQSTVLTIDPPQRWVDAAEAAAVGVEVDEASASEREVGEAIERGDLVPHLFIAS